MVTVQQYLEGARKRKRRKKWSPKLKGNPQRRAVCLRVNHMHKPKKPNSGKRKTATVVFKNKRRAMCLIPGQGHNVSVNMELLIEGGRKPDLPGVRYTIIRKKLDFQGNERIIRMRKRSKYGLKNLRKEKEKEENMINEFKEGDSLYRPKNGDEEQHISIDDKGDKWMFGKNITELAYSKFIMKEVMKNKEEKVIDKK